MFNEEDLDFLTLYWLSGWFGDSYEIWKGKKDVKASTADKAVFPVTLVWPLQEEPEAGLVTLARQDSNVVFAVDWFPGEEFPLNLYRAAGKKQLILMGTFERETIFLHLK